MAGPVLRFHPAAAAEVEAAHHWYAQRSLVAAEVFLKELDYAARQVVESPQRWPRYLGEFRRYVLPRFPFTLIYRVREDVAEIIAVAHAKRKPGYWKER